MINSTEQIITAPQSIGKKFLNKHILHPEHIELKMSDHTDFVKTFLLMDKEDCVLVTKRVDINHHRNPTHDNATVFSTISKIS